MLGLGESNEETTARAGAGVSGRWEAQASSPAHGPGGRGSLGLKG